MDEKVLRKIQELKAGGIRPAMFCSFACPCSDQEKAQHAACQAVNGVSCGLLGAVIEKGTLCKVRKQFSLIDQ